MNVPARRRGPGRSSAGPREADQEPRAGPGRRHHRIQEVEEPGPGPLDVVDDDGHRRLAGERTEETADGPRRLVAGGAGPEARQRGDALDDLGGHVESPRHLAEAAAGARLEHDVPQWAKRRARAVGRAAAGDDDGSVRERRRELGGEPRLSDARLAGDRHNHPRLLSTRLRVGLEHHVELVAPPHERAVELPPDRRGVVRKPFDTHRSVVLSLAVPGVLDQPPGRCRRVHAGTAARERLRLVHRAAEHLGAAGPTRRDDDPGADPHRPHAAVRRRRLGHELERCPDGAERIVLPGDRDSECEERAVGAQIAHGSAVASADGRDQLRGTRPPPAGVPPDRAPETRGQRRGLRRRR